MNQSGFTLLETLVGIAIMTALVMISVPFLQAKPDANLDLATRQIVAQLRQTQTAAIRSSRPFGIVIDPANGVIGSERLAHTKPPIALGLRVSDTQRRGATAGAIEFFPDGGSTGGSVTVSQGPRTVAILVDFLTGRISTQQVRP